MGDNINIENNNKLFKLKRKAHKKIMIELIKEILIEKLFEFKFNQTRIKTQDQSIQFNSSPDILIIMIDNKIKINNIYELNKYFLPGCYYESRLILKISKKKMGR